MTRNEVLSVLGFAECSIEHKVDVVGAVMHINYRYNPKVPEEIFEEYPWTEKWQESLTRAYNLLNVVGDVPLSVMGDIVFGGLNKPDMQYDVNTFPHEFKREIWIITEWGTTLGHGFRVALTEHEAKAYASIPESIAFPDDITHITWSQEWDQKRYAPLIDAVKEILDEVFVSIYGMCLVWP